MRGSIEFASFLVYGIFPIFHTIISKTCYLSVPYYLSDTFEYKNWQVSKVFALLVAFSLNNAFDTASGYMNLKLTYVSLFHQHVGMMLVGLIAGTMFFTLDDLEKPLLVMSFATGICGFSKGNNLLDVYLRELVPIDQSKQNRYTAHIAKALPLGYFFGYTGTGFIYQEFGMKGFGALVIICSVFSLICLAFLRPYISELDGQGYDSDSEDESDTYMINPWTPTMNTMMVTRFWSALADEMYYLIGPIIMYSFVSSAGFGLICGSAQLFTVIFSAATHDPKFKFTCFHYPYIQVIVSFFTIGSFIGLRFTKTTGVASICQFYWVFSHLYIRTSVNTERSAMTLNQDINAVSSLSNIVETVGFIFGSSLGMLFVEAVGFHNGLYAPAGVYTVNIILYIIMYHYRVLDLNRKIQSQRGSLETLSIHSRCSLIRQTSMNHLHNNEKRRGSVPIALMERLLAHAVVNMRDSLENALEREESISIISQSSESLCDPSVNSKISSTHPNVDKQRMIEVLMQHSDLLLKFFQENEDLQDLIRADLISQEGNISKEDNDVSHAEVQDTLNEGMTIFE